MVQKEVKRKTRVYSLIAILLAAFLASLIYFGYVPSTGLKTFSSYNELNSFVTSNTRKGYSPILMSPLDQQFSTRGNPRSLTDFTRMPMPTPTAVPAPAPAGLPAFGGFFSSGPSYSTTNVQVAGVDEVDVVKTDGYHIYLMSSSENTVYIIDANPQNAKVLSKITFDNTTFLAGIYLSQDSTKLAVLGSKYNVRTEMMTYQVGNSTKSFTREHILYYDTKSFVRMYDISDKANPVLTRDFSAGGSYFNSRMIGNYVYTILSQPVYVANSTASLPTVCDGAEVSSISPTNIYYIDRGEDSKYNYYTYTLIVGLNILDAEQEPTNLTIMMGGASNVYASTNNFYITYPGVVTYSLLGGRSEASTEIHKIRVDENTLTFDAQGKVPGNILNQYSMDEYDGYFRIATTSWRDGQLQNNVYALDMNLTTVGRLEGLAPGETLHSARFMGDKCYLVTFQKIDPLFVIDLSQPSYPNVLGELKIPGYSDYLHPFDETHLIGVGKETIEASEGNFAWFQGLKLSLFDVSNVSSPQQMAKSVIGDRGTDSLALSEPKAFLFDKAKELLVIPVNLALINETAYPSGLSSSSYGTFVWQGAYVFNLSLEGGFELRGNVTHIEEQITSSDDSYRMSSGSWISRALYIDNVLYTVSDKKLQLNSLEDLATIAVINLD